MMVMARQYELKARAEAMERTRQRIVEAAVHLHETVGPARTTVTAIAEQAGVGRPTVYRYFPEETDLFRACSRMYWEEHPAPDPERWRAVADPSQRLSAALRETYAYHRRTEGMISRALADVAEEPHMVPYYEHWRKAADVVASAFKSAAHDRTKIRAAVGHALSFTTWRSLTHDQGLSDHAAAGLMLRFLTCLAN